MVALATIARLPAPIPTEFVLGCAGLGSVVGFVTGVGRMAFRSDREPVDPLRFAGYGAGIAGTLAVAVWIGSLLLEVSS